MVRTRSSQAGSTGLRGWLTTVAGLIVLILAGFTLGMLAGIVWEEPELVFAYLSGDTEEIAWNAAAKAPHEVDVAAAAEDQPVDPQIRRERARQQGSLAAPPPVAAAPVGRLAVQVGAFGASAKAESLADLLRSKGFAVYVSPGTKAGESRWRVRVGPLATREEAERVADQLKRREKLPTWILSEDAS